jgi:hypothetical protein
MEPLPSEINETIGPQDAMAFYDPIGSNFTRERQRKLALNN